MGRDEKATSRFERKSDVIKQQFIEQHQEWCDEIPCTEEEVKLYQSIQKERQTLPRGVVWKGQEVFVKEQMPEMTDEEWQTCLAILQCEELEKQTWLLNNLKKSLNEAHSELITIRKCVVFFTVLTVIALIIAVFFGISIAA